MKLLKIPTLEKGWHDCDEVLLYAAFQILADFVEQEQPGKLIDWNETEEQRRAWKEIRSLYRWWTKTRLARCSPLDNEQLAAPPLRFRKIPDSEMVERIEPDRKKYAAYYRALKKHGQLEQKWYEEDQCNLHRLIEIRGHLWT
jgi:hypothetical protein